MKPSIGRIVHYFEPSDLRPEPECKAAVITDVGDTFVSLEVFGRADDRLQPLVAEDQGAHVPFTWHWPERVQEAPRRLAEIPIAER